MTIHQIKYTVFNKKLNMLLFISAVMWSLMSLQNIKLSTYEIGVVKIAAVAAGSPAAVKDSVYDKLASKEMIAATTAYDTNQAALLASTVTNTTTLTSTGNKGQCNNDAVTTIYDHFNENDKNSHKLAQNVEERALQLSKMINLNTIRSAATQLILSSSRTPKSTEATKLVATVRPPAEGMLVPKDRSNKKICCQNIKNEKCLDNKPANTKETQVVKVKLNDARDRKTVHADTNNKNDLINVSNENDQLLQLQQQKETHKIMRQNKQSSCEENKLMTFVSIAHARQTLISQFALILKQITRVTYFTCKKRNQNLQINLETVELVERLSEFSLMLKVVFIDHLATKNHKTTAINENQNDDLAANDTFQTAEWLEQILQSHVLRQIVVLDLDCGSSSRRLLQMASTKAFFNSMHHWLLLEDYDEYVFKRQTEIDDADNIENKMNSYTNNLPAAKSFKEEIVNDSNTANLQVKKLSTYPADVNGIFTSGCNPLDQTKSAFTNFYTNSCLSFNQQQHLKAEKTPSYFSFSAGCAEKTDENQLDVVEKFLEQLNININTELMLAKRKWRFIAATGNSSVCCSTNKILVNHTIFAPSPPPPLPLPPAFQTAVPKLILTNSGSMASHDYNSLQKMDYYLLYDVWNAGRQYGGKLNITKCGNLTRKQGLQQDKWFRTTSTTRRRLNMHLARIRCMVVITHKNRSDTLEKYLSSHYDTHLDSMNRFNFALLTHVRDLYNFSFILSETSTWGYLKNGKFDGMIGALVRKQADIGGSPIFFRIERAKVIDYTTQTWVARPCFIFRHPRSSKTDRIVFLQPFSNNVWICLFASGCLTIILLWLLTNLEHKLNYKQFVARHKNPVVSAGKLRKVKRSLLKPKCATFEKWFMYKCHQSNKKTGRLQGCNLFFESLIFYVATICQQGLSFSTFFFSGRCIVITSLLFSFAIYQFYSASIVGTLLMEKPKTIHTLRDLIHSSLAIGIEDIVYNRDFFLRTNDPDAQELYATKVSSVPLTKDTDFPDARTNNTASPTPLTELMAAQKTNANRGIVHNHKSGAHGKTNEASKWYDPDYGVAKLQKEPFAFHVDVATAYKIIADTFTEKEICELAEIQLFPPQKMVSIVQKGSPLRKAITYGLRRVTEVGLTDYQRKVWHSPKPRCVKKLHTDDLRVDMQTFASALLVLIFGYAVSLLVLSLEIVHFKLWQRYTA